LYQLIFLRQNLREILQIFQVVHLQAIHQ
jgi:hypothetical protein